MVLRAYLRWSSARHSREKNQDRAHAAEGTVSMEASREATGEGRGKEADASQRLDGGVGGERRASMTGVAYIAKGTKSKKADPGRSYLGAEGEGPPDPYSGLIQEGSRRSWPRDERQNETTPVARGRKWRCSEQAGLCHHPGTPPPVDVSGKWAGAIGSAWYLGEGRWPDPDGRQAIRPPGSLETSW